MAADFLDTSALAKHYHQEVGSAEIDRLWNDPVHGLFISRLSVLEIVSVFAAKVRAGAIPATDFVALRSRFSADLTKSKRLTGTRLLVAHYQEGERLLRQLAVALDLHRKGAIQRLVASDKDLLNVAVAEGLNVFDPQDP